MARVPTPLQPSISLEQGTHVGLAGTATLAWGGERGSLVHALVPPPMLPASLLGGGREDPAMEKG